MPMKRKLRVVIDTNVLITSLIYPKGKVNRLLDLWLTGQINVFISDYLILELKTVLKRKRIIDKYNLSSSSITTLLSLVRLGTKKIIPQKTKIVVRDVYDRPVLDTAITAKADYLVTEDKDLLSLKKQSDLGKLRITTLSEFLILNHSPFSL